MNSARTTTNLSTAACLVASLACLSASSVALADTITLKSAARQRGDSSIVTLGDIATLEGEEALRLANVQIATVKPGAKPLEVSVAEVRRAIDAAAANWAKINLSGHRVLIRPARDAGALPPRAMAPTALDSALPSGSSDHAGDDADLIVLDAIIGEPTVRGAIADLIVANLRIDSREMRVRFGANDAALLQTSTSAGRFEIQPLGSLAGDRLAFAVRSWTGHEATPLGQVSMTCERLVQVSRARRDVTRDGVVSDDDIEPALLWLSPSEASQAAPRAAAVGRSLTRSIRAGEIIRGRDLQRSALVKRGDLVTIRCLVGGVAIALQAEARADGAEGDTIEFRKTGERETFLATVTGKTQAVVDLSRR